MSQPDRERAIITARGLFRLPEECVRDVADAMLEFASQEAEWWVEDLTLAGHFLEGKDAHLRKRAAELRSQKSKP